MTSNKQGSHFTEACHLYLYIDLRLYLSYCSATLLLAIQLDRGAMPILKKCHAAIFKLYTGHYGAPIIQLSVNV